MAKLISHGLVAQNRKARHNYAIEDTVEAGLMLTGSEVKSLRLGRCTLVEAFAQLKPGCAQLVIAGNNLGGLSEALGRAGELGLRDRVVVPGLLPGAERLPGRCPSRRR